MHTGVRCNREAGRFGCACTSTERDLPSAREALPRDPCHACLMCAFDDASFNRRALNPDGAVADCDSIARAISTP